MTDATGVPKFAEPPPDYGYAVIFVVSACAILLFGFVASIIWANHKWKIERREAREREELRDAERAAEKKAYTERLEKLDARREREIEQRREDDLRRWEQDRADHERRYQEELAKKSEVRTAVRDDLSGGFAELGGYTHTVFEEIIAETKANRAENGRILKALGGLEERMKKLETSKKGE